MRRAPSRWVSPPGVWLAGDSSEAGGGERVCSGRAQPERFVGEIGETFTDGRGELEAVAAEADAHHDRTVTIEHEVIGGARRVQADGAAQRLRLDAGQPVGAYASIACRASGTWDGRSSGSITGPVPCKPALTSPSGVASP